MPSNKWIPNVYAGECAGPISVVFPRPRRRLAERFRDSIRATCLANVLLLLTLACLCVACHSTKTSVASETEATGWTENRSCHARGKNYLLSLSEDRLRGTPRWKLGEGENPRLSPGKAVSLARRELRRVFPDAHRWSVGLVALKSASEPPRATDALRDRWYYEVAFAPPEPERPFDIAQSYVIYVLSDGGLVTPKDSGVDDIKVVVPKAAPPHR